MTVGTIQRCGWRPVGDAICQSDSGPCHSFFPRRQRTVRISAGKYYTYAVGSGIGKPALFSDDSLQDPAKGRLYFYNLTGIGDVDLYVPAAKAEALKDVRRVEASRSKSARHLRSK